MGADFRGYVGVRGLFSGDGVKNLQLKNTAGVEIYHIIIASLCNYADSCN
jgi:hypothetical protein